MALPRKKNLNPTEDLRAYESHGIDFPQAPNSSGEFILDCPFCDKEKHFFINVDTAQFQCKVCGAAGNKYNFLSRIYNDALALTTDNAYRTLSHKRKRFPPAAFKEGKLAFDKPNNRWLIPVFNKKGALVNLHTYNGSGKAYSTAGCKQHFGGLEDLKQYGPIYLCEGWSDYCAFKHLLAQCSNAPETYSILWAPGAGSFPEEDLPLLQNREVYLLFDNDTAGAEGMRLGGQKLAKLCSCVYILAWPVNKYADGHDITDLIRDNTNKPEQLLNDIHSWCFQYARGANPAAAMPPLVRTKITEVFKDFRTTEVHLYPGLKDALTLTLAAAVSGRFGGEPLWIYLVGPPSSGKSLILESTLGSEWCEYRTAITHKAFISGYRREEGERDQALLAVLPGRCLVIKDYSNVLTLPPQEQNELMSLMRDVFDGKVIRSWGNNLVRQYPPEDSNHLDCRFACIAGITQRIHTRTESGLGDRFLKFEIPRTDHDDMLAIEMALDDTWNAHIQQLKRQASVKAFLSREITLDDMPAIPKWFRDRIPLLTRFVGQCRAEISRNRSGDLHYEPLAESGPRVAKQLRKLTQALCLVLRKTTADLQVYRLVRKVAWDTAHGHRRNLWQASFNQGEATTADLAEECGISHATTFRACRDLQVLGVLKVIRRDYPKDTNGHRTKGGREVVTWHLSVKAEAIYRSAKLKEV